MTTCCIFQAIHIDKSDADEWKLTAITYTFLIKSIDCLLNSLNCEFIEMRDKTQEKKKQFHSFLDIDWLRSWNVQCSYVARVLYVCVRRTAVTALWLWPGNLDQLFLLFSIDKNAAHCTGVAVAIMEKVMLMHTSHTNFCHLWLQQFTECEHKRTLRPAIASVYVQFATEKLIRLCNVHSLQLLCRH